MDKIRITTDEVDRVEVSPAVEPLRQPSEPYFSPPPAVAAPRAPVRWPWVVSGLLLLLAGLGALAFYATKPHVPTVEEWKQTERERLKADLASSPKPKEFIERIHPLVTYSSASLKSIAATTVDGSASAGVDGSNIAELEFVVTYHWAGPVQKNGYTEVLFVWDMQAHQLKSQRFLETTALVNLDNIDWFKLGWQLAPLLFGGK